MGNLRLNCRATLHLQRNFDVSGKVEVPNIEDAEAGCPWGLAAWWLISWSQWVLACQPGVQMQDALWALYPLDRVV